MFTSARTFLRDVFELRYAPLFDRLGEQGHTSQLDERCHEAAEHVPSLLSIPLHPKIERACGQSFGPFESMTEAKKSIPILEALLTVMEIRHVEEKIVGLFRAFPYADGGGAKRLLMADYVEDFLTYVVGPEKVCWFLICTGAEPRLEKF